MQVEIFSDIVCPWCYIGSRRFAHGLADFEHAGEVDLVYRSFELDPGTPKGEGVPVPDYLGAKYGGGRAAGLEMLKGINATAASEGLEFGFDRAVRANSFDAHRLLHLALAEGGWTLQSVLVEGLFRSYFVDAAPIDDPEVLTAVAVGSGLDASRVKAVLGGDEYQDAVRADQALAVELGVNAVPFYVIDRAFGVSGAQDAEIQTTVLQKAWKAAKKRA